MTRNTDTWIERLQKTAEDIEAISLNDIDGWTMAYGAIWRIREALPEDASHIAGVLAACERAVRVIAHKAAGDLFSVVAALADALTAAARALGDPESGEDDLDGAVEGIVAATAGADDVPELVAPPDPEDDRLSYSLDDAAAMLVQLEPGDLADIAALADSLTRLSDSDALDMVPANMARMAASRLRDLSSGEDENAETVLAEVCEIIELAMEARETPGAVAPKAPAPSARAAAKTQTESAGRDASVAASVAADRDDYMPDEPDQELLGEFIAEGSDLIAQAEDALLALENDPEDMDSVGTVFRAFHTVKGTAAFMELTLIAEMGHHAESLLSRVRDKEIRYSGGYADLSLRALDMIKDLVGRVHEALTSGGPFTKPGGYDELMQVLVDPEAAGISDDVDDMETPRLGDLLVAQGKANREAVEAAVGADGEAPIGSRLVKSKAASVTEVGQALRAQRKMKAGESTMDASVRVSTVRLDRLIDMVGELVIAHSMVAQDEVINQGQNHELARKVLHTTKIVRELQDMSMSMRMVPLKATFNKMARLVRDLAKKIGKKVTFHTEGEDTEIDRNLVDVISDPLVHMVRNAVDHGIEPPEARAAAGKSENGTVQLLAYHSAGRVVVEIRDDGKGLDRDAILKKARERGRVPENTTPSDKDIYNLVFEPGFSTAKEVTDVSGRGVGMDVVRRNIESLRGQVEINSEPGRGSVFKMSLPLTLAIIDGMVVRVGKDRYVIPTVSIIRSIKPEPSDISTVMSKGQMLRLQGRLIPLFRLSSIYNIPADTTERGYDLVVVVEDDNHQAGFVIDELIGRQQVVIKTLGDTMQDIPGISGGAIMPNGRVGLILDVGNLVKFANSENFEQTHDVQKTMDKHVA
ncbi:MAG: chemotaxis protein CheA [Pseudomonadota bacterium]